MSEAVMIEGLHVQVLIEWLALCG